MYILKSVSLYAIFKLEYCSCNTMRVKPKYQPLISQINIIEWEFIERLIEKSKYKYIASQKTLDSFFPVIYF